MRPTEILLDPELRFNTALLFGLAYAAVCVAVAWREQRRRRRFAAVEPAAAGSPSWLIAFASQTGTAQEIALHAAQRLNLAGMSAHLLALESVSRLQLTQAERVLFVVSTYGEGDAPDNAARFEATVMNSPIRLEQMHFGLLALGDASYVDYCGFGRRLDAWLLEAQAQAFFPRIDVDRGDAVALAAWQQQLGHLAGSGDALDWTAPAFDRWLLRGRRQLNPGSQGAPLFELSLAPESGILPSWVSGDLAQVQVSTDPGRPRDYSISSLPQDGCVQLLVRLHCGENGYVGKASAWLTQTALLGEAIQMRIRPHRLFRLEDNGSRPLILIGNGSGIAGLRSHLKARVAAGQHANWLIYGERNAATDAIYAEELDAWRGVGMLKRLDRAYSRDGHALRYVQDWVREASADIRLWVTEGAAIYVCGSLQGMAAGIDEALIDILGEDGLGSLKRAGRYRRDVY